MRAQGQVAAVVAHYEERAASYDDSVMHRRLAQTVAAFVDEGSLPVGLTGPVVDVATGTGLVLAALSGLSGPADREPVPLVGVDLSPGMLAVARQRLPEALLLRADAMALPLAGASTSLITCVTGLHLVADPAAVVAEWARVVRPGGAVVTATFADATGHPTSRGDFVRNHEPFRTADRISTTFAPRFALERAAGWSHRDDGIEDRLLLCELRRRA